MSFDYQCYVEPEETCGVSYLDLDQSGFDDIDARIRYAQSVDEISEIVSDEIVGSMIEKIRVFDI